MQNRLKSWALWVSIAALVAFLIKTFSGVDIKGPLDEFLDYLLPVVVGFGIVNNPTDGEHF